MWTKEYTGESAAGAERLFNILADTAAWPEWNAGVSRVDMSGPFAEGTEAVMVLPDDTALPFRFIWVEAGRGFEDETRFPIPLSSFGFGTNSPRCTAALASSTVASPMGRTRLLPRLVPP
jgi:hypothetical protein